MLGHSHSLSGAVTGTATGIALGLPVVQTATLAVFTTGMALLPDLDSAGSCAARCFGWLSRPVAYVIRFISGGHRHATHTLGGIAAFTFLAVLAGWFRHDWAGMIGLGFLVALAVSAGLEATRVFRLIPLPRVLRHGHAEDLAGILAAAAVVFPGWGLSLIPLAVAVGCATHILGDMLTDSGCMLAYPLSQYRWHLLPRPMRITTGATPERVIVDPLLIAALGGLALWVADPGIELSVWAHVAHVI